LWTVFQCRDTPGERQNTKNEGLTPIFYVIQSLRYTVEFDSKAVARIEAVQKKRSVADYVRIGEVSDALAEETLALAKSVSGRIRDWLIVIHPEFSPE
jgi:hypothetical protein